MMKEAKTVVRREVVGKVLKFVGLVLAAYLVILLVWGFWPRSWKAVTEEDRSVTGVLVSVQKPDFQFTENGALPNIVSYDRQWSAKDDALNELMDILESGKYYRNVNSIWPWSSNVKESDGGVGIMLLISYGSEMEDYQAISISNDWVIVSGVDEEEAACFHGYDRELAAKIFALVEKYE